MTQATNVIRIFYILRFLLISIISSFFRLSQIQIRLKKYLYSRTYNDYNLMNQLHVTRAVFLLIAFFAAFTMISAQEICDNQLDDDNDGLIDVFDPDCLCNTVGGFEFIPNGGFEDKSDCCTNLNDENNCLEHWTILQGTPDLYDPDCMTPSDIEDTENLYGFEIESTFINFGVAGSFSETFGTCLLGTLQAGETYLFEADYAQTDIFFPDEEIVAQIAIYGFESCTALENHTYMANPCDNSPAPIELASFFTNTLTNQELLDLALTFTPSVDIESIFIRVHCDNQNSNNQGIFLSMDNLSIQTINNQTFQDSITVNGNVCEFSFFLEVPDNDLYSYQWYYEGNPIDGETNASIELNGQNPLVEGLYSVAIYHPDGCYYYDDFQLVVPTIDQEEFYTLCPGDSVFVAGQYWSETGDYTINYLDTISPCQILLEFHIDLYDQYEFLLLDTICQGMDYEFQGEIYTEPGTYYDSLQSFAGCDSVYILQLTTVEATENESIVALCEGDSYEWEGNTYTESGYYTEEYINQFGCDSVLHLDISFDESIIGDTLFIELAEGEYYVFDGDTFDMEGIYTSVFSSSGGCDSTAFLSIVTTNPCAIEAMVDWIDADCEAANNGIIQIIPSSPNENYQVSIDGGENFSSALLFEALPTGMYSIIIREGQDCETDLGTIDILTLNDLQASINPDTTIKIGGQVTLTLIESNTNIETVHWNSAKESCQDCISFVVSPESTTSYTATIIDENGCSILLEMTIFVRESTDIYVPNIFSPNQDGINDRFMIVPAQNKDYELVEFVIYDRWGNPVHQEQDQSLRSMQGWDGTKNSRAVAQGVYAYYLIVQEGNNQQILKGSITLIR